MGYKRAGDLLVDQAATDVVDRPNVIYAALFCYRQSIELFLKRLNVPTWTFRTETTCLSRSKSRALYDVATTPALSSSVS